MSDPYLVMDNHRKFMRFVFTTKNMKSERNFWIFSVLQGINVSFIFRSVVLAEGIEGKIGIIGLGLCMSNGMFSYVLSFLHHDGIFEIVSKLQRHYNKHKNNHQDLGVIQKCYDEGNWVLKVFAVTLSVTSVTFIIRPFIIYAFQRLTGAEAEIVLPFPAAYLWEAKGVMLYVSFLMQSLLMWATVPMVSLNVGITVSFCMAIVSQLRMAQQRFRAIPRDGCPEEAMSLLKEAVRSHQEAVGLVKEVEAVETVKLFSQVFGTAGALSSCLFRLSCASSDEMEVIVPFVCLSMSVIIHVAFLCFYGQKVINEGDKLYEVIYAVPWYTQSRAFKSILFFSLMSSKQAKRLTAWSFADLSFSTFNSVMTTSYSYVAFLQTMSD